MSLADDDARDCQNALDRINLLRAQVSKAIRFCSDNAADIPESLNEALVFLDSDELKAAKEELRRCSRGLSRARHEDISDALETVNHFAKRIEGRLAQCGANTATPQRFSQGEVLDLFPVYYRRAESALRDRPSRMNAKELRAYTTKQYMDKHTRLRMHADGVLQPDADILLQTLETALRDISGLLENVEHLLTRQREE